MPKILQHKKQNKAKKETKDYLQKWQIQEGTVNNCVKSRRKRNKQ